MRTRTVPITLAAERASIGLLAIESIIATTRARSSALAEAWGWEARATASARVACETVAEGGSISPESARRLQALADHLAPSASELHGFETDPIAPSGAAHLAHLARRLRVPS